jgi:uncharacterized protein (DUF305 family)
MSAHTTVALAQAPIIQPGAPGDPARELTAEDAIKVAVTSYSPADVRFMQDMIPHHHQALEMAALAPDRTNQPDLLEAARRIEASQADEIGFMQSWLRERGQQVPDPAAHGAMHTDHRMAGMASPEQMAQLAAAQGTDFDRLFLELMVKHHEGAVKMVKELLKQEGTAFDPVLFEFTTDVTNDQLAEIEKMNACWSPVARPARGLTAGFDDASEAVLNPSAWRLPRPGVLTRRIPVNYRPSSRMAKRPIQLRQPRNGGGRWRAKRTTRRTCVIRC